MKKELTFALMFMVISSPHFPNSPLNPLSCPAIEGKVPCAYPLSNFREGDRGAELKIGGWPGLF